jgi:dienelactone hydrolase
MGMGSEISEVNDVILRLQPYAALADDDRWAREWTGLSVRLERLAARDHEYRHDITAARKLQRASVAEFMAERHRSSLDPGKLMCYERGVRLFREMLELNGTAVEHVEFPYEGTTLKALYFPATTDAQRAPCLVHFNGFHGLKEQIYLMHGYDLPPRGVAALFVDQPGTGAALRVDGLPIRLDSEVWVGATIDYLEKRADIDSTRIGIVSPSLGGYYMPRAAAFERRVAACVCWGAAYDEVWRRNAATWSELKGIPRVWPAGLGATFRWAFGVETDEEVDSEFAKATLDGVMDKITCPLLILHGENDRQIPAEMARRTFAEAVNAKTRELHTFTREEGAAEHCLYDNVTFCTDYFHDWIVDLFLGESAPHG